MLNLIAILLVIWAWVCVGNVIWFILQWHFNGRQPGSRDKNSMDSVVVIEAVKGIDKSFHRHLTQLINQDHPCFRVIFCLGHVDDPAFGALARFFNLDTREMKMAYHIDGRRILAGQGGGEGLICVDIVIAGPATNCSQKIFNQICAYDLLLPEDRLLAWVDADTDLPATWLKDLIFPIQGKSLAAVTGYRCLVPAGHDWVSAMTCAINSSILTLLGAPWRNSLWGGSMAMTRHTFEKFNISDYVSRCFSDDESVGALLKENGVPIYFSHAVLPRGKVSLTFRQMINFGRRQYICARLYYKFHLFVAWLLLTWFVLGFFFLSAKLFLHPDGNDVLLLTGLITAMGIRGVIRFYFIRYTLAMPEYGLKCLFLETLGTPLTHLFHLMICCAATVGHKVEWAGIKYDIRGPFNVKII